ncbi:dicarboxylate/amino acid:cation symporter [Blautia sp. HCP28S3_G10]|uniref:dicarboxylate/amino acid:cation symporter n=1 Tax=Blautia sp. HCP28S3_G10 TaxID=3438908 RepID=UPI003F8BB323
MKQIYAWYRKHITGAIFVGLILGICTGLFLAGRFGLILTVTSLLGGIYMNALNLMIFPLVFCSIVMGICSIGNIRTTGKITGSAMIFFLSTTALASLAGLIIPRLIHLGKGVSFEMATSDIQATDMSNILDTIKNLIPSNPIAAFANGNMLQVLVFAVIVGFALIAVGEKGNPLVKVIDSLNEVCLKVISTVMYFTPIGVFCTIVPVVEANGTETIISLATQLIILYIAFFGFAIIVYGLAVKIIGKESPVRFFKAIMPAALNAFGTCSSSATIPISKQCMEEDMGVSNQITSIAIPLGATVNMDAVSILMSFMIMFFANACGINVSVSMMVIILLANVLLSVGTPGIPGGAIASFAALATMAGLPAGIMGVYISINTLCDMGATCVNVIGDLACCVVLKEKIKLKKD